ncbi:hypothetical protein JMN32_00235 [Fulvivirga sp. 29W222]|uniref:Uncharacterized protein n=1 Tax=Fulvivirga marina TaxID=2494733 RepID=A0A937FSR4_9BACT|nr:hypothetical protein [Fulvivirga marina]MBL6444715.1 hypothetical protein [Fulvivirga marina]
MKGHLSVNQPFIIDHQKVNVRVKGINRLSIPGSFKVLLKNGETVIASRAMAQPGDPAKVDECVKHPLVDFDFELPVTAIFGNRLNIEVEPVNRSVHGRVMPPKLLGNPTINIRFLLQEV